MYKIGERLPIGAELKTLLGRYNKGGEVVEIKALISDKDGPYSRKQMDATSFNGQRSADIFRWNEGT